MRIDYDKDQLAYALANAIKERDEAKESLEEETKFHHRTHVELVKAQCNTLDAKQLADRLTALELHSTSELARLEQERDEAREKVEQQRKEIVRLNGATSHAGGTPLKIALRERDDAISQIAQAECRAERFCQERDEARDAILGWENKWKCAIDMAARAELERDEALKCAKEYYVEFIRNASSDNKVSKPNPLNPFYKY